MSAQASAGLPRKRSFRREITITLLVKFALLVAVKFLFFNKPADKAQVAENIGSVFGSTQLPSTSARPTAKESP